MFKVEMSGKCENDGGGSSPAGAGGDGPVQSNMRFSSASNEVLLSGYEVVRRMVSEGSIQAAVLPR